MNKVEVKPTIAQVILQQLRATEARKMMCWGARDFIGMPSGLLFQVSGLKHRGDVYVIYDEALDSYKVQIGKLRSLHQRDVIKEVTGIYWDNLGDVIDGLVEQ